MRIRSWWRVKAVEDKLEGAKAAVGSARPRPRVLQNISGGFLRGCISLHSLSRHLCMGCFWYFWGEFIALSFLHDSIALKSSEQQVEPHAVSPRNGNEMCKFMV